MFDLYQSMSRQWRVSYGVPTGLDMSPMMQVAAQRGWDLMVTAELLAEIEYRSLESMKKGENDGA